jgi:ElaB/YqjD/DUF883 family membrane-anchored ribosome-binding protein
MGAFLNMKIVANPQMTLEITEKEKEIARNVKKEFKTIVKELNSAIKIVLELRNAITDQRPSKEDLNTKYRGRLIRYKRKLKEAFNHFLEHTKTTLEKATEISDPEMIRLREILIAEIGELSDGVEALMDLFGETDRDNFTKTLEQITAQLEKRQKSIVDVVNSQLFSHIENDILGRIRISELKFRIQKRSRLIRLFGAFTPEEYEKYYGRPMDTERLKEHEYEDISKDIIPSVSPEVKIEKSERVELTPQEDEILFELSRKKNIASLNYDDLMNLHKELVNLAQDPNHTEYAKNIFIAFDEKVKQQAGQWKLRYREKDFPFDRGD